MAHTRVSDVRFLGEHFSDGCVLTGLGLVGAGLWIGVAPWVALVAVGASLAVWAALGEALGAWLGSRR